MKISKLKITESNIQSGIGHIDDECEAENCLGNFSDHYDRAMVKLLWEFVSAMLQPTEEEKTALLNLALITAHINIVGMSSEAAKELGMDERSTRELLDKVAGDSLEVSREFKREMRSEKLNALSKQYLTEMLRRNLGGKNENV